MNAGDYEDLKFLVSAGIQLFLGVSASLLTWRLARWQRETANADLKLKLYERRYDAYLAFEEFIAHCAVNEVPNTERLGTFGERTQRIEFLFGEEIAGYRHEVLANASALVGIGNGLPCTMPPSVGQLIRHFPGSTVLTEPSDLSAWFLRQHLTDLRKYFDPYLHFTTAGVDTESICMRPTKLPEPPLVKRRIAAKADKNPSSPTISYGTTN